MLDVFLILTAIASGGGAPSEPAAPTGGTSQAAPAVATAAAAPAEPLYKAEPQIPTGRFTTAVEVKPILDMTRANWIAVREYDGKDLLYLTHILSWRCGLVAIHVSVNEGPLEEWPMEACHEDSNSPNALIDDPTAIYKSYPLGSVETIRVEITYDDLTADTASFDRKGAMIP